MEVVRMKIVMIVVRILEFSLLAMWDEGLVLLCFADLPAAEVTDAVLLF
jgi:hypothetical protein